MADTCLHKRNQNGYLAKKRDYFLFFCWKCLTNLFQTIFHVYPSLCWEVGAGGTDKEQNRHVRSGALSVLPVPDLGRGGGAGGG